MVGDRYGSKDLSTNVANVVGRYRYTGSRKEGTKPQQYTCKQMKRYTYNTITIHGPFDTSVGSGQMV